MNPLHLLVILLLAVVQQSGGKEPAHVLAERQGKLENRVPGSRPMDSRNFDSSIRDGSVWLVEFYAPWCGHCRKFEMEYETVALELHLGNEKKGSRRIRVGKVDGDAEKAIASRFSIRGFPTFVVIDGWSVYEYDGHRSREDLVNFVRGGYKEQEPIPFLFSPLGPMGQFKALLMFAGTMLMDVFELMKTSFGTSPIVTGCILCAVVTVSSFVGMIVFAVLLTPKMKED